MILLYLLGGLNSFASVSVVNTKFQKNILCLDEKTISVGKSCYAVLPDFKAEFIQKNKDNIDINSIIQSPEVGTELRSGKSHNITISGNNTDGTPFEECVFVLNINTTYSPSIIATDVELFLDDNGTVIINDVETLVLSKEAKCGEYRIVASKTEFSCNDIGTNDVIVYLIDDTGKSVSDISEVTITDNKKPVFNNLQDYTVEVGADNCSAFVDIKTLSIIDNCRFDYNNFSYLITLEDGSEISDNGYGTISPKGIFPLGNHSIKYTATDDNGNVTTETSSINVLDKINPTISNLSENITVYVDSDCPKVVTWEEPTITDNCDLGSDLDIIKTFNSGDSFLPGIFTVVYSVTDKSGNIGKEQFIIEIIDNIAPVFVDCPSESIVYNTLENDECGTIVNLDFPVATDYCTTDLDVKLVSGNPAELGDVWPVGNYNLLFETEDESGNTASCNINVEVIDKTIPVIDNAVENNKIVFNNIAEECQAVVTWDDITFTDACNGKDITITGPIIQPDLGLSQGDLFPVGIYNITYNAKDKNDNINSYTFVVEVNDTEKPVISIDPNQTIYVGGDICGFADSFSKPIATDNCTNESNLLWEIVADPINKNYPNFPPGKHEITYNVSDESGNTSVAILQLTVIDDSSPNMSHCIDDILVYTEENQCAVPVLWEEIVIDESCEFQLNQTHKPGDEFAIGTTTVVYTASDEFGNISKCSFDVTVIDNLAPIIEQFDDVEVFITEGCSADVNIPIPEYSDNCGFSNELTNTHSTDNNVSGIYHVGKTKVTYNITDNSGNIGEMSFYVIVENTTPPYFTSDTPENGHEITVNSLPDMCGANVEWIAPKIETCLNNEVDFTNISGDFFEIGRTEVIYTFKFKDIEDIVYKFIIVVVDNEAPIFETIQDDITINASAIECGENIDIPIPSITDCKLATNGLWHTKKHEDVVVEGGQNASGFYPIGETVVTYYALDEQGNQSDFSFKVIVIDNTPPTITCPQDIYVTLNQNQTSTIITYDVIINDNCTSNTELILIDGKESGSSFEAGIHNIKYEYDNLICEFKIYIYEFEPPSISCPIIDDIVLTNEEEYYVLEDFTGDVAIVNGDMSDVQSLTQNLVVGEHLYQGSYTIVFTATFNDESISECYTEFKVIKDETPDFEVSLDPVSCTGSVPDVSELFINYADDWEFISQLPLAGDNVGALGANNIVVTLRNKSDDSVIEYSVTYVVSDLNPPTFTLNNSSEFYLNTNGNLIINSNDVIESSNDDCSDYSFDIKPNNFSCTNIGETIELTIIAIDTYRNRSEAQTKNIIIGYNFENKLEVPENINTEISKDQCSAIVNWNTTITGACYTHTTTITDSEGNILTDKINGAEFFIGTYKVTEEVKFQTEVEARTKSFIINVFSNQKPVMSEFEIDNISLNLDEHECEKTYIWAPPTILPYCGGIENVELSFESEPFVEITEFEENHKAVFPAGKYTITYTATDKNNESLTSSRSFEIEVRDTYAPEIRWNNSGNKFATDPSVCFKNINLSELVTIIDYCGTPLVNVELSIDEDIIYQGDINYTHSFAKGTTKVKISAKDANNGETIVSKKIEIVDEESPYIDNIPSETIVINNDSDDNFGAIVSWNTIDIYDNCTDDDKVFKTIESTPTAGLENGSFFPIGFSNVKYFAMDEEANDSVANIKIEVKDTFEPVIYCIDNIVVNAQSGECGANLEIVTININTLSKKSKSDNYYYEIKYDDNGVYDQNDIENPSVFIFNNINGDIENASGFYEIGETEVEFLFVDLYGNKTKCEFTVTVVDNEFPTQLTFPEDIILSANTDNCGAVATWENPTFSDNCEFTFEISHNSGDVFPVGTTIVNYKATDNSGNITSGTIEITIEDKTAPNISADSRITIYSDTDRCGTNYKLVSPTVSDNCDIALLTYEINGEVNEFDNPEIYFIVGTTEIIWLAKDLSNNFSEINQQIIVLDTVSPTITYATESITKYVTENSCSVIVGWEEPTFEDNCTISSITKTEGSNSGSEFLSGHYKIAYSAKDKSNNETIYSFDINILDTIKPTISCIDDITATLDLDNCTKNIQINIPNRYDNCEIVSLKNNLTSLNLNSSETFIYDFPLGETEIIWTVLDNSGNETTCKSLVTIIDNQIPEIVCTNDIVIYLEADYCSTEIIYDLPVVVDNCTVDLEHVSGPKSGDEIEAGEYEVVYRVSDKSGNENTCSFFISVIDNTFPIVTCPESITEYVSIDECSKQVFYTAPYGYDDCGEISIELILGLESGSNFPTGETVNKYIISDEYGNRVECEFIINVIDAVAPTALPVSDKTFYTNNNTCSATITWEAPEFTDNCNVSEVKQISGPENGSVMDVGTYNVTYEAVDNSGNTAQSTFAVIVVDNEAPILTCKDNRSYVLEENTCTINLDIAQPVATDNCGISSITNNINGLETLNHDFQYGESEIIWTATDIHGNTSECIATIFVDDVQYPEITCVENISINLPDGVCSINVNYNLPIYFDNCEVNINKVAGPESGDLLEAGTYTVTYQAIDKAQNSSECSFTITVNDVTAPLINCTDEYIYSCDPTIYNLNSLLEIVECNQYTITNNFEVDEKEFAVGNNEIIFTVTDIWDNSSTCKKNIVIYPQPKITMTDYLKVNIGIPISVKPIVENAVEYEWSYEGDTPESGLTELNLEVIPTEPSVYILTITTENGCTESKTITVDVQDNCIVPNAISPNGDGINDVLIIPCIEKFPNTELVIFNRWGGKVFRSQPYNGNWQGQVNYGIDTGSKVKEGTYFYHIYFDGSRQPQTGFIEVKYRD